MSLDRNAPTSRFEPRSFLLWGHRAKHSASLILHTSCFTLLDKFCSNPSTTFFQDISLIHQYCILAWKWSPWEFFWWCPYAFTKESFLISGLGRQTHLHVKFILLTAAFHLVHSTKWILRVIVARFWVTLCNQHLKIYAALLLKIFFFYLVGSQSHTLMRCFCQHSYPECCEVSLG